MPTWSINGTEHESVADLEQSVEEADIVILLQAHREYKIAELAPKAKLFFDTRGVATSEEAHVL